MSKTFDLQTADGVIVHIPGQGKAFLVGLTVPADAGAGYLPGCIFMDIDSTTAGAQFYINEGTVTSCAFRGLSSTAGLNSTFGNVTFKDATNMVFNTTTGTEIGNANTQKFAFWGATPIVQPAGTGELLGLLGNAATAANATNMNSNGNTGATRYDFNDVIKALKTSGILAT